MSPAIMNAHSYTRVFSIAEELEEARRLARRNGVHLLMDEAVTIQDVRFLGATLWTDDAI